MRFRIALKDGTVHDVAGFWIGHTAQGESVVVRVDAVAGVQCYEPQEEPRRVVVPGGELLSH